MTNSTPSVAALERLGRQIDLAGELLPAQGPITAFVFLNTLQALEDLPYDEGVAKGARLFGCQPYLSEERYRQKMAKHRIRIDDLAACLREDAEQAPKIGESRGWIDGLGTRHELRLAMLEFPLRSGPTEELRWFVAETSALMRLREETPRAQRDRFLEETRHWVMRDLLRGDAARGAADLVETAATEGRAYDHRDRRGMLDLIDRFGAGSVEQWSERTWESFALQALWRVCRGGVHGVAAPKGAAAASVRHRDAALAAGGEDSDALVNEILIPFCAAFADQGFADWALPERERGFFQSFCSLYRRSAGPPNRWRLGLADELRRLQDSGVSPLQSIHESLETLGVGEFEWGEFVPATLLALRGWAGLLRQMEVRGDRVPLAAPAGTLIEFVAVRLVLERLALAHVAAADLHYRGSLAGLRTAAHSRRFEREAPSLEQRAFTVFQLAQVRCWSPGALFRLSKHEWTTLVEEIESFSELERRRIFHEAFERRLRIQALDAITLHVGRPDATSSSSSTSPPSPPTGGGPLPRFQAVFCIDTREESFRRHLEEVAPDTETFGAAGFFGVAIYYRGVADAYYSALCPIVIRPQHWVTEEVVYSLEEAHRRRAKTRKALGTASHQVHLGSRSITQGALLTAGLGVLATVPLVARVLFPRLTARIRKTAGRFVAPPAITRLQLERTAAVPGPEDDHVGFTVAEMADRGERMLRDIGLTSRFARLVMFFGHGSFCLNNPHKSAYDCGACSGGAGGPNARALAAMLNDSRVRALLAERGLAIPADTIFLGGLHNTCVDSITFHDLDLLPRSHQRDFEAARATLEQVCERNAHERCRRFQSAPLNLSFAAARAHVEGRSQDLAQTRPEFGNASNALCFVGRRSRLRQLYLDRRAFLHSYDPTRDDDQATILARILSAVVPVCSGINLQYNFSYIDSPGWGCGTKLPHNVTSLLGVMDGAMSDLRTGLPWQGVEIHEPVRLLLVLETTPDRILRIMEQNPVVGRILGNRWMQLALLDPESAEVQEFRHGRFAPYRPEATELPRAATSADWYRGWRDHLEFARIEP